MINYKVPHHSIWRHRKKRQKVKAHDKCVMCLLAQEVVLDFYQKKNWNPITPDFQGTDC